MPNTEIEQQESFLEAYGDLEDMAMLIRKLAHELKKANTNSDLPARALDYLRRKGLEGNILRTHHAH